MATLDTDNVNTGKEIQIFDGHKTETSKSFQKVFRKFLKGLAIKPKKRIIRENVEDIDKGMRLMVLCHNHSRIGTDIDYAVSKLTEHDPKNIAVIVIHPQEKHITERQQTLPVDNLTDEKYDKYECLVDFAYTASDGIYDCDMNTTAKRKLEKFIKNAARPCCWIGWFRCCFPCCPRSYCFFCGCKCLC